MNTKAITNIQRQLDILSDGHQEVVDQAVSATAAISAMDDLTEKTAQERRATRRNIFLRPACQQLNKLQEQLIAQARRALRVYDEVEQIKTNLRIV